MPSPLKSAVLTEIWTRADRKVDLGAEDEIGPAAWRLVEDDHDLVRACLARDDQVRPTVSVHIGQRQTVGSGEFEVLAGRETDVRRSRRRGVEEHRDGVFEELVVGEHQVGTTVSVDIGEHREPWAGTGFFEDLLVRKADDRGPGRRGVYEDREGFFGAIGNDQVRPAVAIHVDRRGGWGPPPTEKLCAATKAGVDEPGGVVSRRIEISPWAPGTMTSGRPSPLMSPTVSSFRDGARGREGRTFGKGRRRSHPGRTFQLKRELLVGREGGPTEDPYRDAGRARASRSLDFSDRGRVVGPCEGAAVFGAIAQPSVETEVPRAPERKVHVRRGGAPHGRESRPGIEGGRVRPRRAGQQEKKHGGGDRCREQHSISRCLPLSNPHHRCLPIDSTYADKTFRQRQPSQPSI